MEGFFKYSILLSTGKWFFNLYYLVLEMPKDDCGMLETVVSKNLIDIFDSLIGQNSIKDMLHKIYDLSFLNLIHFKAQNMA